MINLENLANDQATAIKIYAEKLTHYMLRIIQGDVII